MGLEEIQAESALSSQEPTTQGSLRRTEAIKEEPKQRIAWPTRERARTRYTRVEFQCRLGRQGSITSVVDLVLHRTA